MKIPMKFLQTVRFLWLLFLLILQNALGPQTYFFSVILTKVNFVVLRILSYSVALPFIMRDVQNKSFPIGTFLLFVALFVTVFLFEKIASCSFRCDCFVQRVATMMSSNDAVVIQINVHASFLMDCRIFTLSIERLCKLKQLFILPPIGTKTQIFFFVSCYRFIFPWECSKSTVGIESSFIGFLFFSQKLDSLKTSFSVICCLLCTKVLFKIRESWSFFSIPFFCGYHYKCNGGTFRLFSNVLLCPFCCCSSISSITISVNKLDCSCW